MVERCLPENGGGDAGKKLLGGPTVGVRLLQTAVTISSLLVNINGERGRRKQKKLTGIEAGGLMIAGRTEVAGNSSVSRKTSGLFWSRERRERTKLSLV